MGRRDYSRAKPRQKNKRGEGEPTLKEKGFYYSGAWRRARQLALHRDNYLCQECLRQKRITPATQVHHLIPLESRPDLGLELSNLESLCWPCHEATKLRTTRDISALPVRVIKI